MYTLPQPPLVLLAMGFFIGVTCGLAFEAALKIKVNYWSNQGKKGIKTNLSEISVLKLPFMGICLGICVFLAAGLEIFTYNRLLSYGVSLPLTLFIGILIWVQLKKLIVLLLEGGSEALDLDSYF
ncbi:hypothetical protein Cyast_1348 [Cyanobacterium stanieri PCC 7202]|uniref:Uncharacterized protein n=1 Tax=Cyanobacterium stanieri (strain ATCC 29140 / PCC 7202) TaxID=292563 RepID=K9YMI5_CYASC|nr:hypothetical protein Cyast_1348 [Cyanobacterium stanieri PCC 7202]